MGDHQATSSESHARPFPWGVGLVPGGELHREALQQAKQLENATTDGRI